MIPLIIFVQLFAAGFLALYLYVNHRYSYWSRRGVPGPRSIYPFGFTLAKTLSRPDEYELGNVRRFGPLYGVYTGTVPTLTVADPVLIKELLVANFAQFSNRRQLQAYNPVWNRNMFNLDVAEWKRVRAICSPIFTSGKLKAMIPLMDRCIDNLLSYIDSKIEKSERPGFINVKQTLSGFSIDVIAATTFATDTHANGVLNKKGVDSSEVSDKKTSDFVHYGTSIFKVPPLKVAAALCLPRPLLNLLGISTFFSEASFEFLISLSRKIFRERQSSKSKPAVPDLIQLMSENFTTDQALNSSGYDHLTASMDHEPEEQEKSTVLENKINVLSQNGSKPNSSSKRMLDENEILGQLVLFFFAGFETTAFTLTTALFELAHQPEIQERLYRELTSFSDKFNSNKEEYYDQLLNHAPYLEAVIKETLRKHPNVVRLERRVSAPEGATLGKVHLDQDVLVEVPILAVHHNPNFYPEPELYNPERFMPENKDRLVPYAYLPFGGGPKNCLGMRFAYQEMKLCLARVLSRYRFSLAADTPTRLIYAKGAQLLVCEPFHLAVELR